MADTTFSLDFDELPAGRYPIANVATVNDVPVTLSDAEVRSLRRIYTRLERTGVLVVEGS